MTKKAEQVLETKEAPAETALENAKLREQLNERSRMGHMLNFHPLTWEDCNIESCRDDRAAIRVEARAMFNTRRGALKKAARGLMKYIFIVFDGPPSHVSGRFVEVEDEEGKSIEVGDWVDHYGTKANLWALQIADPREVDRLVTVIKEFHGKQFAHQAHDITECPHEPCKSAALKEPADAAT